VIEPETGVAETEFAAMGWAESGFSDPAIADLQLTSVTSAVLCSLGLAMRLPDVGQLEWWKGEKPAEPERDYSEGA